MRRASRMLLHTDRQASLANGRLVRLLVQLANGANNRYALTSRPLLDLIHFPERRYRLHHKDLSTLTPPRPTHSSGARVCARRRWRMERRQNQRARARWRQRGQTKLMDPSASAPAWNWPAFKPYDFITVALIGLLYCYFLFKVNTELKWDFRPEIGTRI